LVVANLNFMDQPPAPGSSAVVLRQPPLLDWLVALLLGVATLVLFWPATRCDFINYDDPVYVTSNPHVSPGLTAGDVKAAFTDIVSANWHPVTMLSHALDCQLFGLSPWGHHLTGIVWHSINTVLVFVWLRRMTGARWPSWFVAAFFGLSPLRVESAVWVAERKDVLSGFFGLLALISYVEYARGRQPAGGAQSALMDHARSAGRQSQGYERWAYGLAWLFLGVGLLSKPMLVTWPLVMLLLDYWPLQRLGTRNFGWLLTEKIPFFALAVAASLVTYLTQKHEGAMTMVEKLPVALRGENAVVSYGRYLEKIFWPSDLAVLYPLPKSYPLAAVLGAGAVLAVISGMAWLARRRCPYGLMGWLWFCGTLVPVIGLVQVGSQAMADRYTYLPSLGILIAMGWGAAALIASRPGFFWPVVAAAGVGLAGFSAATHRQIGWWRNSQTLFEHTLVVTRDNYYAHNNLGTALFDQGQVDAAVDQYQDALGIEPGYAECYNNLGVALDKKGQLTEAVHDYQTALRLKPELAGVRGILGADLVKLGDNDEAIHQLREALRTDPGNANAHNDLGNALDAEGQTDQAIAEYQAAIRLQPTNAPAHSDLGAAYGQKGLVDDAIAQLREAARLNGADPLTFYNLGMALYQKGQTNEAVTELTQALRMKPDWAAAQSALKQMGAP
jgi:Flp pilus assembly protein TadD